MNAHCTHLAMVVQSSVCVCVYIYMYIYEYMCIYVCICLCIGFTSRRSVS